MCRSYGKNYKYYRKTAFEEAYKVCIDAMLQNNC